MVLRKLVMCLRLEVEIECEMRKRLSQLLNIGGEIWRSGSLIFYVLFFYFYFIFYFFFSPRPTVCDHM